MATPRALPEGPTRKSTRGRLLPQLRGLVFEQCPLGRIGELHLSVECNSKLCDLGADHTVCLVSWAQRGTHLSVGTNQGSVQVRFASNQQSKLISAAVEGLMCVFDTYSDGHRNGGQHADQH
ncbi:uncharacterized protein LOC119286768 [Triticum dicoccoides]|uniref:uncharacterized protein LOC119286768 n=1 Tax=Triticum dicoccoides TaxID=85692 RepID=UPI001890B148|nr:uncharacterized protein LOC119286768 [Triticum dicoccoides]